VRSAYAVIVVVLTVYSAAGFVRDAIRVVRRVPYFAVDLGAAFLLVLAALLLRSVRSADLVGVLLAMIVATLVWHFVRASRSATQAAIVVGSATVSAASRGRL
jgi:hypothetical protein